MKYNVSAKNELLLFNIHFSNSPNSIYGILSILNSYSFTCTFMYSSDLAHRYMSTLAVMIILLVWSTSGGGKSQIKIFQILVQDSF
jgi:hypothetical protein